MNARAAFEDWMTTQTVRLTLAGAGDVLKAEIAALESSGRMSFSTAEMRAMYERAWERSGKQAERERMEANERAWNHILDVVN